MSTLDWKVHKLEPSLVLGWRNGPRTIHAGKMAVNTRAFGELRKISVDACNRIDNSQSRRYSPHAALDDGEHYEVPVGKPSATGATAIGRSQLMQLMKSVRSFDRFDPTILADERRLLFYAITFEDKDQDYIFIRKMDPRRKVERGLRAVTLVLGARNEVVKAISRPDLVIDLEVDLVLSRDRAYILNQRAFEQLLADIQISTSTIERDLGALESRMTDLPMTDETKELFETICRSRPTLASRIRNVCLRLETIQLSPPVLNKELSRLGSDRVLVVDGSLHCESEHDVTAFLDIVEGRWFDDELGDERRRADRFSKRE